MTTTDRKYFSKEMKKYLVDRKICITFALQKTSDYVKGKYQVQVLIRSPG
jgi:hypothetical protein